MARYPLEVVISELEREQSYRVRAYQKWIAAGTLNKLTAQRRMDLLQQAIDLLRSLPLEEPAPNEINDNP